MKRPHDPGADPCLAALSDRSLVAHSRSAGAASALGFVYGRLPMPKNVETAMRGVVDDVYVAVCREDQRNDSAGRETEPFRLRR